MVWPWLDYTLAYVMADEEEHPTAVETLKYWTFLRVILLQDVAAMLCLMPEDDPVRKHGLLEHPVFQSTAFLAYVEEMRAKLQTEGLEENDPNLKSVERALPGVNKQFTRTRTLVTECHVAAEEAAFHAVEAADGVGELKERVSQLEEAVRELPQHTSKHGRRTRELLRNFASCLKRGFNVFEEEDEGETDEEDGAIADASPSSPAGRRFVRAVRPRQSPPSPPRDEPPLEPVQQQGKRASLCCFWCLCDMF